MIKLSTVKTEVNGPFRAARCDEDGYQQVKVIGSSGGASTSDTTEATQLLVKTAVEAVNTKTGEVQASPTANTILGRLKDLLTGIVLATGTNSIGKVGVDPTALTNVFTSAYASSLVVSATPKKLFGLTGFNSGNVSVFVQIHNATSLPADTAVPEVFFIVPAISNFSIDFGINGRTFSTGIVVCTSTTGPTKTLDSAVCWFDAQVL